jgi:hypothetical protein
MTGLRAGASGQSQSMIRSKNARTVLARKLDRIVELPFRLNG